MDMVMCAVYDKVAAKCNDPFVVPNLECAKRLVRSSLLSNTGIQSMASDLELLELAVWSPDRCELTPVDGKPSICVLADLLPSSGVLPVEVFKTND